MISIQQVEEQNFLIEELIKAVKQLRLRAQKAEKELADLKKKKH